MRIFSKNQKKNFKKRMRKQIYYLLLIVDPETKISYANVDVDKAFENVMQLLAGYNSLIGYPDEMVTVLSSLSAAKIELHKSDYNFKIYRKLILDAGSEILKIKGVD
jgi:hypothetical protein